jgi:uncharacterized protein YciI
MKLEMYYLLLYDVVEHYVEKRKPLREAHLDCARKALARGELVLGGAFTDPVDGAALVFKGEDVVGTISGAPQGSMKEIKEKIKEKILAALERK